MLRAMMITAAALAVWAWCPHALAQEFDQGTVTLSAERIFGLNWTHSRFENDTPPNPPSRSNDVTTFGIGWYRSETAYHNPRVGVDVFVIDRLSLGGALGIYGWSGDRDRQGFLFAPRIGYAASLGKSVGIWPRGGLTFFSEEDEGGGANYTQFALSGEAMFAFFPHAGWAILLAPTLDLGLTGKAAGDDFRQHSLGIATGLMGVI